eukprot:12423008-Karenia_brevis.AAC.1
MTGNIMFTQLGRAHRGQGDKTSGAKISMSAAAACPGGASPYFAPGLALPHRGWPPGASKEP